MTTSGTTNFNLEFTELAEEAWERAGREMRSGYDLRTARRSMNLLTIEFANRGINLWTLESGTQLLTPGIATYNLPTDTIDILEHVIRTNAGNATLQSDLTISRISVSTYSSIPAKLTQGRPIQIFVERLRDQPRFTLWPVPDDSIQYTLAYYRLRRIQDAGTGVNTPDAPFRFLPAIAAGLAYHIALKTPDLMNRVDMLKREYDEQFNLAAGEDREKASVRFVPRIYGIRS
jgi:hypothetical protein